jgi:integrase
LLISELILAFFRHVQKYYVKDGEPTSEQDNIRQALRFVRQLYGATQAREFGPLALKNVRSAMIAAGRSRKLINKDINRIRGMFGWAVENELLPVEIHQALRSVKGLRKGRSEARETAPIKPVPDEDVRAILPQLSPQVGAMIQLQHLSGARPQEIISIRPCDVVTDGDIWLYFPHRHKTEHFDRNKVIVLGPKAQQILRPWLDRDPESYCFVPAETFAWHYNRIRRGEPANGNPDCQRKKQHVHYPGSRYTRHSYRTAVQRACERAGVSVWSPLQLRHARATALRRLYGIEAAKAVLGHTDTKITEIYAQRDLECAVRIMREVG